MRFLLCLNLNGSFTILKRILENLDLAISIPHLSVNSEATLEDCHRPMSLKVAWANPEHGVGIEMG
ncbi:MAG: hypothetical protein OHK0012_14740 [Synechococcales cyanobacterium]